MKAAPGQLSQLTVPTWRLPLDAGSRSKMAALSEGHHRPLNTAAPARLDSVPRLVPRTSHSRTVTIMSHHVTLRHDDVTSRHSTSPSAVVISDIVIDSSAALLLLLPHPVQTVGAVELPLQIPAGNQLLQRLDTLPAHLVPYLPGGGVSEAREGC